MLNEVTITGAIRDTNIQKLKNAFDVADTEWRRYSVECSYSAIGPLL